MPAANPSHANAFPRLPLDPFFDPAAVALIGATDRPGSVGLGILENLRHPDFHGAIYPVNPKRQDVLGLRCFPNVQAIGKTPDLAVIVTPAAAVPAAVRDCAAIGVPAAVIITAGFKETGEAGAALERDIREAAGGMRIIGPNCVGIMRPWSGLNATFARHAALPGSVAFLSQSGALCTAILDWSRTEHVGFSAFVSVGSMLDVGWGDLIDHFGADPRTSSIIMYMESIGDARAFLSAARDVALAKPIVVIKPGRTQAGAKAAASHTGSLTGSDDVLDAAFRRCGVLRVRDMAELFSMAEVLAKQPRPAGPRLTIVTNAGGPAVLAADALVEGGGELAPLSATATRQLDALLPPHWSHDNPVDILGDADVARYAGALDILGKEADGDAMLVMLSPQAMTDAGAVARRVAAFASTREKPLLACWMGGEGVADAVAVLNDAGVPTFPYPDAAARTFNHMWQYSRRLQNLYETPVHAAGDIDSTAIRRILETALAARRVLLTEPEAKQVLAAAGIPVTPTRTAAGADAAVAAAAAIGYPVVVKLLSETITHKSDIGGVRLNLRDAAAVRDAFTGIRDTVTNAHGAAAFQGVTVQPMIVGDAAEVILGSSIDPQFGPVLLFGTGGRMVEIYRDRALALPPLTTTLARRLMERTSMYSVLKGARGLPPADMPALEAVLVRFAQLVTETPRIREIDINPLWIRGAAMFALDARIILHPPETADADLPRPAIRPYPAHYIWRQETGGIPIVIRPIRPDDEPAMAAFHAALSPDTVYRRFFQHLELHRRVAHERLMRLCCVDYDREFALVMETGGTQGRPEIAGAGRLRRRRGGSDAELSMVIADAWQHRGLGTELLRRLIEIGRAEGLRRVHAEILTDNRDMADLCTRHGFHLKHSADGGTLLGTLEIA